LQFKFSTGELWTNKVEVPPILATAGNREPLSFGPVIERILNDQGNRAGNDALRLSDGKLFNVPKYLDFGWRTNVDPQQMSHDDQQHWLDDNGINLAVNSEDVDQWNIVTRKAKLAVLPDDSWETMSAAELRQRLASMAWKKPAETFRNPANPSEQFAVLSLPAGMNPPGTFAFETDDGDSGLLQIVSFGAWSPTNSREAKLRYKLAQRTDARNHTNLEGTARMHKAEVDLNKIRSLYAEKKVGMEALGEALKNFELQKAEIIHDLASKSESSAFFGLQADRNITTQDADNQGLVFFKFKNNDVVKPPFPLTLRPGEALFVELTPELKQWIKTNDVDVLIHFGLKSWDMVTLEMQQDYIGQPTEWATTKPEKAVEIFARKDAGHLVRSEVPACVFGNGYRDGWNTVEAFRTRDDTIGIYQMRGIDDLSGRGVKIRYKLVQGGKVIESSKVEPADLREARAKLAELRANYGEQHPEIQRALARIRELERMTAEEPTASAELREARAHLAELRVDYSESHPAIQRQLALVKELERLPREGSKAAATPDQLADLKARLEAASSITSFTEQDKALAAIVRDAAKAGEAALAKQALAKMTSFTAQDQAALEAARALAKAGHRTDAIDIARSMTSFTQRDAALKELAQ
jgi:hypothetical protein